MEQRHSHADRRKHHVIYKTTCLATGRYYIGMHSTDDLNDGYIGSGKRLWRSIRKHGAEQHRCEVLEHLPSREALRKREAELVNERLLEDKLCMNLALGGHGGFSSAQMKVIWGDPEYVAKQKARPYCQHNSEVINTLSEKAKAQWKNAEYKSWKSENTKLINNTPEYKAKQRTSWTPERRARHKELMSAKMSGVNNPNFGKKRV